LSSTVVRGSSIYTAAELFPSYREYLGQAVTNASARAIVSSLAARYEQDGYSRPQIRIDDGLLAAGVLRIDILETRIGTININGKPGPYRDRLEALGSSLQSAQVIRQSELREVLSRMRALPGLSLSAATARDDDNSNVYRLDLDTQFKPATGSLRFTNRGTDEVGPNFLLGQTMVNGLLGGGTSAGILFSAANDYDEYRGLGGLANIAIGNEGSLASITGFRSRSNPHEPNVDRDDTYLRDRLSLRLQRPLQLNLLGETKLSLALDFDDLAIFRSDLRLRDERLRMLEVGVSSNWRNAASSQSLASVELVKGLNAFNSGLSALDLSTDERTVDLLLLRLSLIRLMRLSDMWSIRLDSFAQHSNHVLPYSERFKIGGDRLGRGFEVTEIAGDSGLGAKAEMRRRLGSAVPVLGQASVYGFYDIAATWKQNETGRESAASAGFGFATQGRRISGALEFAKPLTHADVEGRKDLSVFVEITVQL
jgi:hemolysin activation/secretion protein